MTSAGPGRQRPLPSPGMIVPLVTPLHPDRSPDLASLDSLIAFAFDAGADGVLVLGSSGEGGPLAMDDRLSIAARAVAAGRDRGHVMIGVPPSGAGDLLHAARSLDAIGGDSLLVTAPVGLALSQPELRRHFEQIVDAVATPVVAYEVPVRVGVSLGVPLVRELAESGALAGLKDSSGNIPKARSVAIATRHVAGFVRYTGTEECIDSEMAAGYDGSIPGIANVYPDLSAELSRRVSTGDAAGARDVQDAIVGLLDIYGYPLAEASASAAFFAVVKEALVQLGVIATATSTAPLTPADDGLAEHVARCLAAGNAVRERLGLPLRR